MLCVELKRTHRPQFFIVCVTDPSYLSPDVERAKWTEPSGARLQPKESTEFVAIGPTWRLENVIRTQRGACFDVDVGLLRSIGEIDDGVGQDLRQHRHQTV